MKFLPRDGIVNRSILVMLLAFLVAGIGIVTTVSYSTAQRTARTIDTRLNQLLDTVESTVRIACFLKDRDLAREVSMGLLSNSEVLSVQILAEDELLARESRAASTGNDVLPPLPLGLLERKIQSPFSPGTIVGTVRLEPNSAVFAAQRNEDILFAVTQLTLQLLLVSGAVVAALIIFVVRPISRISQALHGMDPTTGERLSIPLGQENTEIGHLVNDVNQLSDHLVAALREAGEARRAAEAASVAKSHFLANMSHEIRTPLTAVQGFARMGARDCTDPAHRENFTRILDAGNHLLGVINDILDFSKIEAGKLEIESRPISLTNITAEAVSLMVGRAREKGLDITLRQAPDIPAWIMGDPMRLRQILVNLLSNAIKFSQHGTIDLNVLPMEDEIWLAVRDEGIGMTEEEVSRLFKPFEQADISTTRKYGGTGLGLSISMNLASLMGGTIRVMSTPWHGSTFTLQLPLDPTDAPPTVETTNHTGFELTGKLSGYRILAAEDIEANRLILADLLDEAGATYVFAENGRAAVERAMAAMEAFDVVLMDVQMPVMDGNEATRRIHATLPALPVIGLTAHGMSQDRSACLAAGMKDHVTKPVDPKSLVTAILCWATPGGAPGKPLVRSGDTPAKSLPVATIPTSGEVDWALLDKRFKGKRNFIRTIIRSTLDGHADAAERLCQLAAARDFPALAFFAHSLKGIYGNLAARPCQELSAAVEQAAKKCADDSIPLAEQLAERIPLLYAELGAYLADS